jgi:hypothetical protein
MPVSFRRKLAYVAASVISGAGMMLGHNWAEAARAAGGEAPAAQWLGVGSWVIAGVVAALIDRTAPARAIGFASLALPLVWFGMTLVSEGNALWVVALLMMLFFGLLTGLSAAATQRLLRPRRRHRRSHHR